MKKYMTKKSILIICIIAALAVVALFFVSRASSINDKAQTGGANANSETVDSSEAEAIHTETPVETYGESVITETTVDGRVFLGNPSIWPIMFTMPGGWRLESVAFEDESSVNGEIYIVDEEGIKAVSISIREKTNELSDLAGYAEISTGILTSYKKEENGETIVMAELPRKSPPTILIMTVFSEDIDKAISIFETLSY